MAMMTEYAIHKELYYFMHEIALQIKNDKTNCINDKTMNASEKLTFLDNCVRHYTKNYSSKIKELYGTIMVCNGYARYVHPIVEAPRGIIQYVPYQYTNEKDKLYPGDRCPITLNNSYAIVIAASDNVKGQFSYNTTPDKNLGITEINPSELFGNFQFQHLTLYEFTGRIVKNGAFDLVVDYSLHYHGFGANKRQVVASIDD